MTPEKQKEITIAFLDSIKESMIKKIDEGKVPGNFDGFEIRHWVAMIAEHEDHLSVLSTRGNRIRQRRRRECENDVNVNNLY